MVEPLKVYVQKRRAVTFGEDPGAVLLARRPVPGVEEPFDPARDLEEGPCPACGGSGSEEDEDGKRWCCSRCDGDGTTEELR